MPTIHPAATPESLAQKPWPALLHTDDKRIAVAEYILRPCQNHLQKRLGPALMKNAAKQNSKTLARPEEKPWLKYILGPRQNH